MDRMIVAAHVSPDELGWIRVKAHDHNGGECWTEPDGTLHLLAPGVHTVAVSRMQYDDDPVMFVDSLKDLKGTNK